MVMHILPNQHPDGDSFKLRVTGDATVQDYLDTINRYYLTGKITRLWAANPGFCEGCHYCCHEPAPVTLQDAYQLMAALNTNMAGILDYLWIEEQQGAVDITLGRPQGDACIFLQPDGRCSIYNFRPLVCQTYVCCPVDDDHERIRSAIVNQGEDALIRWLLMEYQSQGQRLPVNRGSSRRIRLADWPANKMGKARNYRQVNLKDILPSDLYRILQSS